MQDHCSTSKQSRPPIERTCLLCGNHFWVYPNRLVKGKANYCSAPCARKASRVEVHHFGAERVCAHCGQAFSVSPSKIGHRACKYCSAECAKVARRAAIAASFAQRFWSKVNKNGPVVCPELGPCWVWTRSRSANGYAVFSVNHVNVHASRVAYELTCGPIPEGLWVLHKCDNPVCVRGDHLFLGSAKDNTQDMLSKGRAACGERNGYYTQPERRSQLPGEGSSSAKLTDDAVVDIRKRFAGGTATNAELAAEYKVTGAAISAIVYGKNWTHLPVYERKTKVRRMLSEEERNAILTDYGRGKATQEELAIRYGTNLCTIARLARAAGFVRGKPPA